MTFGRASPCQSPGASPATNRVVDPGLESPGPGRADDDIGRAEIVRFLPAMVTGVLEVGRSGGDELGQETEALLPEDRLRVRGEGR